MSDEARRTLRAAWDAMLADLARARDAIDDPASFAPPPTERGLAEGYRYLAGLLGQACERAFFEDPAQPSFRQAIHLRAKSTIDNPDAIYFAAPIDGHATTIVRGRAPRGFRSPTYLLFECASGYAGDSGSLAELRPGSRAMTGSLDSSSLVTDRHGDFEILLAPERPAAFAGNFVATTKTRTDRASGSAVEYVARWVSGRQLFHDWEHEDAVALTIERSDAAAPPPLDVARAAASLERLGALTRGQMHFWNAFYDQVLETHGDRNGDGVRMMPRNALNEPNAQGLATGGGQSTNVYAGGVFELAPDDALVVTTRVPVPPLYAGAHLASFWGESLDFANHASSLNGFQAEPDADGAVRFVVAHRDPGVPNWLDTTGLAEGFMAFRWSYTEKPPRDRWPTVGVAKVGFDEIRSLLPAATRTVSAAERAARIRVRREHVQRRYRQF
jgi:hypothetical protein